MKNKFIIVTLACLFVLGGCEPNMPEWSEDGRQMLIGNWTVVKETMTNGDGFGGVYTHKKDFHWNINYWEFSNSDALYNLRRAGEMEPRNYTLQQQEDKTWLLTIEGLFDSAPNIYRGNSPITIYKLTSKSLEWQFESYGGDEGPVVYYQYLVRK